MKTKVFLKLLTICIVAFFTVMTIQSCKKIKPVAQADLEGFWILKSLNGKDVSTIFEGAIPTLEFNFKDSLVSGTGGCNHYTGKFSYKNGLFNAPNLAVTRMLCAENNAEPEFIMALANNNNELSVDNGILTVTYEDKPTLVFEKGNATISTDNTMEPNASSLSGIWTLKTIDGIEANTKFINNSPTINFDFDNKKIYGNDGCNNYNATFSLNKYNLLVDSLISTRMACDNMASVAQYVQAIKDSSIISIPNSNILQFAKNGTILLVFEKTNIADSIQ